MSDFAQVAPKQTIAIRPLTKGMFRDRSALEIADGGFWTVRNMLATTAGLFRRPAFYTIAGGDTYRENAVDAWSSIRSNGDIYEMFVTETSAYRLLRSTGLTLTPFPYTTGTVASSDGLTITGTSTAWTSSTDWDNVGVGDYFVLDSDGTAVKITAVNSATEIELESEYPDTSFTGETYTIQRGFRLETDQYLVDAVIANDRIVFLSPNQVPCELNEAGTALEYFQASGGDSTINSVGYSAAAGAYFQERLWIGNVTEWTGSAYTKYRQRLRFSTATDMGNIADTAYIDLNYTRGEIKAIVPMGNLLTIYLGDAIYFGQSSPDVTLPLTIQPVQTGGVGLVGQKAVVPYIDGHFFVGQDNIYFLSTRGMEAIGTPVVRETIRKCEQPWRIYGTLDTRRNRVMFGFPEDSKQMTSVWSFDYRTQAWSYETYSTYMIASLLFNLSLTWDDLTGTWDTLDQIAATWDDFGGGDITETSLIRSYSGVLQQASSSITEDSIAGVVTVTLESKDHDLNLPDTEKTWTRLALKLNYVNDAPFDEAVDFVAEVSYNRGRTWKDVGVLRIRAGMDEGHCDFRLTSSHFRFRLTNSSAVPSYWITEYTFNVTPIGVESHLGSQGE